MAPAALEKRRVLVVEDEYFLADDIAHALRQVGAEVIGPVPTCAEALAELERAQPLHAAVLDINLDGEASYPVADALRAREIPFVFGTGYGAGSIPAAYADVPQWRKPFEAADLIKALPNLISPE